MKQYTKTFYPTAFEVIDSDGNQVDVTNINNCINEEGNPEENSYARFYDVTGAYAETFGWWSFDLSEIPPSAIINNISGRAKVYCPGGTAQINTKNLQVRCNNRTITKGITELIVSTSIFDVNMDSANTWTGQNLQDLEYLIYVQRTNNYTTSNYSTRVYGAEITVTWSTPDFFIKKNNSWIPCHTIWKKENGIWVKQNITYLSDNNLKYLKKG